MTGTRLLVKLLICLRVLEACHAGTQERIFQKLQFSRSRRLVAAEPGWRPSASSDISAMNHDSFCKVSYNNKLYHVPITPSISFSDLVARTKHEIHALATAIVTLEYTDADGDVISIEQDSHLRNAQHYFGKRQPKFTACITETPGAPPRAVTPQQQPVAPKQPAPIIEDHAKLVASIADFTAKQRSGHGWGDPSVTISQYEADSCRWISESRYGWGDHDGGAITEGTSRKVNGVWQHSVVNHAEGGT